MCEGHGARERKILEYVLMATSDPYTLEKIYAIPNLEQYDSNSLHDDTSLLLKSMSTSPSSSSGNNSSSVCPTDSGGTTIIKTPDSVKGTVSPDLTP